MSNNPILWVYDQDRPTFDLDQNYIVGRATMNGPIIYYLCEPVVCDICSDMGHDFRVIEILEPYDHSLGTFPVGEKMAGDSPIIREIRSAIDQNDITWWET